MIVGGPGTGKTSTVVKLLALLVSDAQTSAGITPRILLVAPTGKAAQRLGEAIEKARDTLPIPDAVKQAIPSQALTIHRALGSIQGSITRFRHDREHPLECDLMLLDEASMVDLALMRRLLDAAPAHARVILLGDPDQLVSVEAGGVLGDLCAAAEQPQSVLHGCLSLLTRSYRYPEGSGIAALAQAVHRQDADAALDVLRTRPEDVQLHPTPPESGLGRALEAEARLAYAGLSKANLDARLSALDHFRVLCAHRKGPASVERLNPALARLLTGRSRRPHEHYAGRPILITHNEYATQLFNGDVGVLHAEKRGQLLAHFRAGRERVRSVALARLPSHESVYAMTVHKSQGSEFERVAIVLPERPSPILTRELLYTAITRAKRGVSLYASEASLRAAIAHRTTRTSGLKELLGT
jgi:exodeoxyribonuclease V alpha subunit